jgi:hypothetical protein
LCVRARVCVCTHTLLKPWSQLTKIHRHFPLMVVCARAEHIPDDTTRCFLHFGCRVRKGVCGLSLSGWPHAVGVCFLWLRFPYDSAFSAIPLSSPRQNVESQGNPSRRVGLTIIYFLLLVSGGGGVCAVLITAPIAVRWLRVAAEELRLMALVSEEQKQLMVDAQAEVRNRVRSGHHARNPRSNAWECRRISVS